MYFPTNAVQRGKFQGTACTTLATDPQTGLDVCTNNHVTILNNASNVNFKIYQVTFSSARALSYQLFCDDGVDHLIQGYLGQGNVSIPTNVNCNGSIEYAYSGTTSDTFVSIIYGTTTPTMATNTPYIITRQDQDGLLTFEQNPLGAQIGYGLWIIYAIIITWGIWKIMK